MQPASDPVSRVSQIEVREPTNSELRDTNSDSRIAVETARSNALIRAAVRAAFNAQPVAKRPSFTLVEVSFTCPGCNAVIPTKTTQWEGKAPDPLPSGLRCDPCAKAAVQEILTRDQRELVQARAALFRQLCPPALRDTAADRLPNPVALKAALAWVAGLQQFKPVAPHVCSLLLHGVSRTGKTRIAFEVLRVVLAMPELSGDPVVLLPGDLAREVADAYREGKEKAFWSRLVFAPLLILDDLGKEKLTERVEAFLFELLDRRFSLYAATVITTNHTGADLAARFLEPERGAALVARLKEFCLKVAV